jgi:hypothetical protein
MNFKQCLQAIELVFWMAIGISCLVSILRGKALTIPMQFPMIFILFIMLFTYSRNIGADVVLTDGHYIFQTAALLVIAGIILLGFKNFRKNYFFLGLERTTIDEAIKATIKNNNLHISEKGENAFIIEEYPDDLYQVTVSGFVNIGVAINLQKTKKGDADQFRLIPKLTDTICNQPMGLSAKIFLFFFVLISSFGLYISLIGLINP